LINTQENYHPESFLITITNPQSEQVAHFATQGRHDGLGQAETEGMDWVDNYLSRVEEEK
jgi:hypothetical protein